MIASTTCTATSHQTMAKISNMMMWTNTLSDLTRSRAGIDELADVRNEAKSVKGSATDTWSGLSIILLGKGVIGT